MDDPPARQSRLICSNSSTRDLAIPDLHADNNDVTIRSRVGPIFATTRRPTPPGEITTQAGPKSATKQAQTGASSGDHTHVLAVVAAGPSPVSCGRVTGQIPGTAGHSRSCEALDEGSEAFRSRPVDHA